MHITDHELLRLIGGGSYGQVWLARNVVGTLRAVKVVARETFGHAHPYEREYAGLQRFEPISRSHDGLVDILQIGRNEAEGHFYYVMELADDAGIVKGRTCGTGNHAQESGKTSLALSDSLTSYVPRTLRCHLEGDQRLPLADCIELGLAMTSALEHLHQHGLVHRDVKPSNIIFVGGIPKLADVGLVTNMTEARSFVGTEGFIPPEGPGSPCADLYSLGKVLYEASTGLDRNEFPKLPPDLKESAERAQFSEFNEILLKACATEARHRYATANEMRMDLKLLERGKSVRQRRILEQRWSFCRKAAFALGTLALMSAAAFVWSGRHAGYPLSADSEVNNLIANGNLAIRDYTPKRLLDAFHFFTEATKRAPLFAPAHIGVLRVRIAQQYLFAPDEPAAISNVCAAVTNLLRIAPDLAESCMGRAYLHFDLEKHESEGLVEIQMATRKAAGSKEGAAWVHETCGRYLLMAGQPEEALRENHLARREGTADPVIEGSPAVAYLAKGDLERSLQYLSNSIRLSPVVGLTHKWVGRVYEARGEFRNAISEYELFDQWSRRYRGPELYDALRQAADKNGSSGYWGKLFEINFSGRFLGERLSWSLSRSAILMHLGKTNDAYQSLEEEWKSGDHDLAGILLSNCWNPNDPPFKMLARKVGMPPSLLTALEQQQHYRKHWP